MQSQPLRAWKMGLTASHGVPSLKFLTMTWMPTWQQQHYIKHFGTFESPKIAKHVYFGLMVTWERV